MKKNYFLAIAVAALMLATTVAQAADITFSGQFRPRFNIENDADDTNTSRDYFDTRVRLNAAANINANTSIFLQFQSNGQWGLDETGAATETVDRTDRDSGVGSDILADVGFHQAFVTLKNFMGLSVDAKVGRQEVVLDGHRLFGHTGWTTGAQTNDAIRLDHSAGNHTINYIYIASSEAGASTSAAEQNKHIHIARANTQGIMGGNLTGMFVVVDDNSAAATSEDENIWYTVGARQSGKLAGLDYRVEYYHQFGDGGVSAASGDHEAAYATTPTNTVNDHIDRDASMFGIRLGKTFKNSRLSPTFTLWYDSLSGTDDDDVSGNDYGTFDTVQDTGHKFYGLIDNFTHAAGNGTQRMGLQDIAIKTKFKVSDVNTLKLDFHQFLTQTDLEGGDSDQIRTNSGAGAFVNTSSGTGVLSNDLGQEIDVTLVHKYDSNTKLVVGYSHYFTTLTHSYLNASGAAADSVRNQNDGQDWFYVMMDTKF